MTNNPEPVPYPREFVPPGVRIAGGVATVQGLVLLGFAVYLVVHAILGYREETVEISGYGTAIWFVIMGGALTAAAVGMLRNKRWGRGLIIIAQLVLLPVAYYLGVGSGQWAAGVIVGVSALSVLVCLFRRESLEWYAA